MSVGVKTTAAKAAIGARRKHYCLIHGSAQEIDANDAAEEEEKSSMKEEEVKTLVWQIARESAAKGIGWAQEGVVMRAVRDRLKAGQVDNQDVHHMVLNAWHDLFADKRLAWGYNLDNPNAPFFHTR